MNSRPVLEPLDLVELEQAMKRLEQPSLAARIAHRIGAPVEKMIGLLPAKASGVIASAARAAIHAALKLALRTLGSRTAPAGAPSSAATRWHKLAGAASGAAGGAFGLAALAVELPVSTTIMMRAIASVARSEGADLAQPEVQLECVMVLGLGSHARADDDAAEIGYFAAREALSRAVGTAATHIASHGLAKEGAPALVRLITLVAERYAVNVTEKAAAQLVPLAGAVGGAAINAIFIDHFQEVARGHFTLRRLERKYGMAEVQAAARSLRSGAT
ncbi:MAG TPA: EcsC family protein [Burkholderiaceae bacterium]|nr:EcsC family protein [Burkholderiaceae bacterium]